MYVSLSLLTLMIIINCLCTIGFTSSTNKRILRNLKHIVDNALEQNITDDISNDAIIEQLSQILEQEEGFRIVDREQRSIDTRVYDGSGDEYEDYDIPPFYLNMSIAAVTMVCLFLSSKQLIIFNRNEYEHLGGDLPGDCILDKQ